MTAVLLKKTFLSIAVKIVIQLYKVFVTVEENKKRLNLSYLKSETLKKKIFW